MWPKVPLCASIMIADFLFVGRSIRWAWHYPAGSVRKLARKFWHSQTQRWLCRHQWRGPPRETGRRHVGVPLQGHRRIGHRSVNTNTSQFFIITEWGCGGTMLPRPGFTLTHLPYLHLLSRNIPIEIFAMFVTTLHNLDRNPALLRVFQAIKCLKIGHMKNLCRRCN